MHAVYLCRPGDNEELRYSLRSLRNVADIDHVWIFGDAPEWCTADVVRVAPKGNKFDIVHGNLLAALDHPEVAEDFVLFNDDMYVMHPIPTTPTLNRGTVQDVLDEYATMGIRSHYTRSMEKTRDRLERAGYTDLLSFELHTPMPSTKTAMREAMRLRSFNRWNTRTAHGAVAGTRGDYSTDVKVYRPRDPIPAGPFLSTSDLSIRWITPLLADTFPEPSQYEKTN